MKYFFTLLLLATALLTSVDASAKTLTLKASANSAVCYLQTSEYSAEYLPISTDGVVLTFDEDQAITLKANDGWLISYVANSAGAIIFDWTRSEPVSEADIHSAPFSDGEVVTVNVVDGSSVENPVLTIRGDKDAFRVSYNYADMYPNENGEVSIEKPSNTVSIYATNDYILLGAVTDKGDVLPLTGSYITFYGGRFADSNTVVTVESKAKSELEQGSFTVKTIGTTGKFNMYDQNYDYTYFNSSEVVKNFTEGDSFYFYASTTLYKLEINGETKATLWNSYEYTPQDGDEITIYTEMPNEPVNFNISFGEGCDAGVIKEFRYDYNLLSASVWNSGTWQPMFGKVITLQLNTSDYKDVKLTVNGTTTNIDQYSTYQNITVVGDMNITIEGQRQAGYNVTIIIDNPDGVRVCKGYTDNEFDITGQETKFELSRPDAVNGIQFRPKDGYMINNITVLPADTYVYEKMVYVSQDNTTIEVEVGKYVRDKQLMVYVGEATWQYGPIVVLSQNNSEFYKQVSLTTGYNSVEFADGDLPLNIGAYPQPVVYLNGTECANVYGAYEELKTVQDGDVLKLFGTTPAEHSLSYEFSHGVRLDVFHDHVTHVAEPASHTVLDGTQVHLKPVSTLSNDVPDPTGLVVRVNDTQIQPASDGNYSFTVNGDTNVSAYMIQDGVENVRVDNPADSRVFNLQGVCVGNDINLLPAGIYIVNGQKVRK